ncbi:poly(ADP-ribose) glycohydrolase domain-containing protein [Streptomyces sp. NPDC006289]|uniref:poly(ADP-ribose) glycohydrolase domain-containing protein n=1 Tax=Streptomyces sp. NPDC006289 TaxID=3156744 RepID=UPI0033A809C6
MHHTGGAATSARLRGVAGDKEAVVAGYRTAQGREVPIGRALSAGLSGTRLHGPEPVPVAVLDTDRAPVFEGDGRDRPAGGTPDDRRAGGQGRGAENHASARDPGGGHLNGARAQEESPCRGSALHTTLLRAPDSAGRAAFSRVCAGQLQS